MICTSSYGIGIRNGRVRKSSRVTLITSCRSVVNGKKFTEEDSFEWSLHDLRNGKPTLSSQVVFNPKDNNTFASASLDWLVKVWQLGSAQPNFTLEGHTKGVNCIEYYSGGEKPYLISGADDRTVKIWDYQNKTCVQVRST